MPAKDTVVHTEVCEHRLRCLRYRVTETHTLREVRRHTVISIET